MYDFSQQVVVVTGGSGQLGEAVLPAALDTPKAREAQPNADTSRWITPAALAKIILFLASPDGDPISGSLIPT